MKHFCKLCEKQRNHLIQSFSKTVFKQVALEILAYIIPIWVKFPYKRRNLCILEGFELYYLSFRKKKITVLVKHGTKCSSKIPTDS